MFGGVDHPGGEFATRNCLTKCRFRESRLRYVPGSSFHPGATRTNGVEKIERCRCIGSVAIVICPPASTSRADERNVGKEIERSATSIAAPLRCSPAAVAEQTERNRRPHIKSVKSPLLRCRHCYFPGGVDHTGQDPSRTKSLHGAPVWHCCPGYFPAEVTM